MANNASKLSPPPDRSTDEKLFFGDNDEFSIRYDSTDGFVVRDETSNDDLITIDDAGDAIDFAKSLGSDTNPIPGTTYFENANVEALEAGGFNFIGEFQTLSDFDAAAESGDRGYITDAQQFARQP